MLTLITGASSSGKSLLGESISTKQGKGNLFYIATMENGDQESQERIQKHRNMRKEKNFYTIEQPIKIHQIKPDKKGTYLLECMSNLVANEMYREDGAKEKTKENIIRDMITLHHNCDNLIIITNEVFSDIPIQDKFCLQYIETLANINCELAKIADIVIESVVGIPIYHKGETLID